jgi:hypothetical protein
VRFEDASIAPRFREGSVLDDAASSKSQLLTSRDTSNPFVSLHMVAKPGQQTAEGDKEDGQMAEASTMEEHFETGKTMIVQKFVGHLEEMLAGILKQRRMFGELANSIDSKDIVKAEELATMGNELKTQELNFETLRLVPGRIKAATNMAEVQEIMNTAFDFG